MSLERLLSQHVKDSPDSHTRRVDLCPVIGLHGERMARANGSLELKVSPVQ